MDRAAVAAKIAARRKFLQEVVSFTEMIATMRGNLITREPMHLRIKTSIGEFFIEVELVCEDGVVHERITIEQQTRKGRRGLVSLNWLGDFDPDTCEIAWLTDDGWERKFSSLFTGWEAVAAKEDHRTKLVQERWAREDQIAARQAAAAAQQKESERKHEDEKAALLRNAQRFNVRI